MASLTIRNLDDEVKRKLRIRSAENNRSMEAEAREIIRQAVTTKKTNLGLASSIREIVAEYGGESLELPDRKADESETRVPDLKNKP